MISEERLKTLIEQEKIVYDPDTMWGEVGELKLNKTMKVIDGKVCGDIKEDLPSSCSISCNVPLEDLFETRADAEEYLKYGDITRTENFPYVSWEEFCKCDKTIEFCNKKIQYSMYVFVENENTNNCRIIIYADDYTEGREFDQPLTRENYHKALDLAIRLWKGEE